MAALARMGDESIYWRSYGVPYEARRAGESRGCRQGRAEAVSADRWVFETAAEEYFKAPAPSWKPPCAGKLWLNPIVKYAYPVIGGSTTSASSTSRRSWMLRPSRALPRPANGLVVERAGSQRRDREWARHARHPAHVKLIKAVRPTNR
jgi:hypothetical protein